MKNNLSIKEPESSANSEKDESSADELDQEYLSELDDLDLDPKEKRLISIVERRIQITSGLLPPPEMLQGYEDVVPGAGKMILDNMLAESGHRRAMDDKSISYASRDVKRGQWQGFAIAALSLFLGAGIIFFAPLRVSGTAEILVILSGFAVIAGSVVALVRQFTGKMKSGEK